MLKRIISESDSKALLVLPYVALVQEKVRWLRQLVQGLKFPASEVKDAQPPSYSRPGPGTLRVVGFFGGGKVRACWTDFDIGVCTLEKVHARLCYFTLLHWLAKLMRISRQTCSSMRPLKTAPSQNCGLSY